GPPPWIIQGDRPGRAAATASRRGNRALVPNPSARERAGVGRQRPEFRLDARASRCGRHHVDKSASACPSRPVTFLVATYLAAHWFPCRGETLFLFLDVQRVLSQAGAIAAELQLLTPRLPPQRV